MSLSPTKYRTLSRQPSSPSLAVGLPPAMPESSIMAPSSSSRNLKRSLTGPRIHRGDVSSSADSSAGGSGDGPELGWVVPFTDGPSVDNIPKRRVMGSFEQWSVSSKDLGKKRDTLSARLQQVARVKKSKSTGDSLNASPSLINKSFIQASETKGRIVAESPLSSTPAGQGSDKVVVCVRLVRNSTRDHQVFDYRERFR